jgi:predicted nucleotidyltransferase
MGPAEWRQYRPFRAGKDAPPLAAQMKEARRLASTLARELRSRFGAERVVLFGSLARGEFSGRSDIDLAVWGIPPGEFYRAVAFASGCSRVWAVDLVDADDCSEALKRNIEQEGISL